MIAIPTYNQKIHELNESIAMHKQQYDSAFAYSMRHYERFIMNEIELPEFRIAQAAMYDAESKLEAAQEKLKAYQESYSRYKRMRKVCDKELPFKEIIDEIDSITVEAGRKAIVHWL